MKIRNGFVSNSSSSSFVVINKDLNTLITNIPENFLEKETFSWWEKDRFNYILTLPIKSGQMEFGWQFERYYSFEDKLNYVIAQIMSLNSELSYKYLNMLREVLKKHTIDNIYLSLKIDYNYFHWDSIYDNLCYVDHQSAYYESKPEYHTLFLSEENLENFLFNSESFIQCGNDNEDPTPEWEEASRMEGSEYRNMYLDEVSDSSEEENT